ncbi:hypothetical protein [Pseudopedobacter beijingensis]|uniref:Uncharacterized protein n=1 Tax=Pseudopedobacter beijingensis TaxID=1207056 RepID=A0ABW4I7M8_9SPHI
MNENYFRKGFSQPIISSNGIMTFTLLFETDINGSINAYDSSLKVSINSIWNLSNDEAGNTIITIPNFKIRKGTWISLGVCCNIIHLEDNLKSFDSAYDIVGE